MKLKKFPQLLTRPRAAALVAALFLLTVSFAQPRAHAQTLDRIERERVQAMLTGIKEDLKKNYYDPNFRGMDIEARFKQADEKLKQAASLGQALGIVAQVLLDLNDSHTFFSPPARTVSVEYGWQMQMIGDQAYVVAVRPGSDAEKKGLKPGDLIVAVENFRPTRKDLWKMIYYYYTMSPRPGMRLVVQSPGGEPRQLDVAAKMKQHKRVIDLSGGRTSSIDVNDYIRESEASYRRRYHRYLRIGSVTVWKMPGFGDAEVVDRLMNEHVKGSSALILDLRGNPGGSVPTLERLVSHFFDREVKIADIKGRKEMKPSIAKKRSGKPFEGKVVVLVDSESGSAAEAFARLMQIEKRGIVIGDQSAGAVMQSEFYERKVGSDTIVMYGASITNADVIMTDGKSLENIGVTPDELVLPTAADLAAERDPVLARAAELVGVKLDPAVAGKMFPIEWEQ